MFLQCLPFFFCSGGLSSPTARSAVTSSFANWSSSSTSPSLSGSISAATASRSGSRSKVTRLNATIMLGSRSKCHNNVGDSWIYFESMEKLLNLTRSNEIQKCLQNINLLWPSDAIWQHRSGATLVLSSIKPLPEPMLTYPQKEQFHKKCS